jgi:LacI family transcriptional regulator
MQEARNKRVGIKDIALKAGVSIGTVDRVLHNRGEVKEETQKKIMEIVEELEYTPNIFAKSLSSKKTTRIAIVIPDSSDDNPYWAKHVVGINKAADELIHYNTEIVLLYFDASTETSFNEVLKKVSNENIDGVVLNPVFQNPALFYVNLFTKRSIPVVFIDNDILHENNLAYFGQDAEHSGKVAARLMDLSTHGESTILILKLSKLKVFSAHIENRIIGFTNYIKSCNCKNRLNTVTIEIDLNNPDELSQALDTFFSEFSNIQGIFIPNSRGFKLAAYLEQRGIQGLITIGYDLINDNVKYLKKNALTYLLSQKPENQAYGAIYSLFNYMVTKKQVNKTNYSAIDIIMNENIDYYLQNK